MKSIITISRQFGAGGSTIGRAVAEKLGYYYCDKDMILRAALESGSLTPLEISKYDEKVPTEFGFGQSLFDFYNKPLDERLFNAQREAVRRVAEKGKCVIVGRNANIILKSSTGHFMYLLQLPYASVSVYYRKECPGFPRIRYLKTFIPWTEPERSIANTIRIRSSGMLIIMIFA